MKLKETMSILISISKYPCSSHVSLSSAQLKPNAYGGGDNSQDRIFCSFWKEISELASTSNRDFVTFLSCCTGVVGSGAGFVSYRRIIITTVGKED